MYEVIAHSPGRINIIGEHTDYNDGFVLPAAIDKRTTFKLRKNSTENQVHIKSINFNTTHHFELTSFEPVQRGWENYVMGVVKELQKLEAKLEGFDGEFEGDVPIGAGMSSSAALVCSLAYGLNELFELNLDTWQLIKVSQLAEHNFVGIKCGIIDQFTSMLGKEDQVMLLDCRSLEYKYYPLDLQEYELILLNTNVSHSLVESEYNKRRQECQEAVHILHKKSPRIQSLRDLTQVQLYQSQKELSKLLHKRCKHVTSENQRVHLALKSLLNKNFNNLGRLMYQSHHSLKNDYEVSCPELDFLVEQASKNAFVLGSRMMGGGFGGCTLSIIKQDKTSEFIEQASTNYYNQFKLELSPYSVKISDGSSIV